MIVSRNGFLVQSGVVTAPFAPGRLATAANAAAEIVNEALWFWLYD